MPFLVEGKAKGEREAVALARLYRRYGTRRGNRILDVGCGIGRVAIPLAMQGYHVIGVDLSPRFIAAARTYARVRGVRRRTKFVVGDYRGMSSVLRDEAPFQGILNTFTSIGYYGKEQDRRLFAELARHAVPRGVFVVKTVNRDWILQHFERQGWARAGNVLLLEDRKFDARRSHMVNRWEFLQKKGSVFRPSGTFRIDHHIYNPEELKDLMVSTGWRVMTVAANFSGDPIDLRNRAHTEVVLVGRLAGSSRAAA
jgi:SAM-dependent methyltransferase